jgi:arsenate reductase
MAEIGFDISEKRPKSFLLFEGKHFDYLITICDGTKDKIPNVNIQYSHKIHLCFSNPRKTTIPEIDHLDIYREVRDEIRNELEYFYNRILQKELIH